MAQSPQSSAASGTVSQQTAFSAGHHHLHQLLQSLPHDRLPPTLADSGGHISGQKRLRSLSPTTIADPSAVSEACSSELLQDSKELQQSLQQPQATSSPDVATLVSTRDNLSHSQSQSQLTTLPLQEHQRDYATSALTPPVAPASMRIQYLSRLPQEISVDADYIARWFVLRCAATISMTDFMALLQAQPLLWHEVATAAALTRAKLDAIVEQRPKVKFWREAVPPAPGCPYIDFDVVCDNFDGGMAAAGFPQRQWKAMWAGLCRSSHRHCTGVVSTFARCETKMWVSHQVTGRRLVSYPPITQPDREASDVRSLDVVICRLIDGAAANKDVGESDEEEEEENEKEEEEYEEGGKQRKKASASRSKHKAKYCMH